MTGTTDFDVLWEIGRSVLAGTNPYLGLESWYPPAATMLFSIFALAPAAYALWIWRGVLLILLASVIRREGWAWIAYLPLPFVIVAGQVDLVLVALIPLLQRKDWQAALAAFAFTLKPIVGIMILPWFLISWLKERPRLVSQFIAISLVGHTWPLLIRPTIFSEWASNIFSSGGEHYFGGGLWSLNAQVPIAVLAAVSVGLVLTALLTQRETLARSALALASPVSMPYHQAVLTGTAPAWLMAGASITAVILFYWTGVQGWRALVPATAFLTNALIRGKELS